MATSTVADAISGLVTIVQAATPTPPTGADVIDGPPIPGSIPDEYISIGIAHEAVELLREEQYAATGSQSPAGLGNLRRQESYDISCRVSCTAADTDMEATRARAFALLAYVETAVRDDGTLDGSVIFGDVGKLALRQLQTGPNAVAVIDFDINVKFTRI
jgi:hypothetical protein